MLVGIIGGSGFYKLKGIEGIKDEVVDTPFGEVSLKIGNVDGHEVAFIPRHSEEHSIPPHKINYRANIFALFKLGVKYVIATNAVGSLKRGFQPGSIVLPDQIIDLTKNRTYTFFDGSFSVKMRDGTVKGGVVHTDVTEPYCNQLRGYIIEANKKLNLPLFDKGTYVCMEGPRFETPAEIKFLQIIGGDLVGMTGSPEVFLAKELDLCYASISVVTNYAAGMQEKVTHEEVIEIFNSISPKVGNLIIETAKLIHEEESFD
ncbi:MAG: S-methyl-5'-thioadenosine phosphorylase [Candidatus Njordarchaeia archaeon]